MGDGFAGPVVALTSFRTVGSSENFALMLDPFEQVRFVGRDTAGVNGNATGVALPGQLGVLFTAMDVLYPDGSPFYGVGIAPDMMVWPRPATVAQGRDEVLDAALAGLRDP